MKKPCPICPKGTLWRVKESRHSITVQCDNPECGYHADVVKPRQQPPRETQLCLKLAA